ncbi:MAG TPA: ABC transporter ATP-binding protein [Acetobacteraceae bacterium]|nr:ABC transporter ATP-binding protein [Acetobacteraceae bacterium]
MPDEILQLQNLTIRAELPNRSILLVQDVSFAVARNRTTCLVGESGSGKTLTARAAMRLVDAPLAIDRHSRILMEGRDLMRLAEPQMRALRGTEIAMIFQEPMSYLNPVYTVGHQVAETLVWHRGVSHQAAAARVQELFRLVGIPSPERRMHQFPYELSGGMQQRVMIAMALACEPKLLIADEPTTALDVTIQAQILDLLSELQQRLGMAILLITHDLGVVAEMADDIVVMYAGAVVETGPAAQVLAHSRHPYTEALLRSIPRLGMRRDQRLNVIPGMVPAPGQREAGCRFAPRCGYAFAACAREPALRGETHRAACWKTAA